MTGPDPLLQHLSKGETVAWRGQPQRQISCTAEWLLVVIALIPLSVFAWSFLVGGHVESFVALLIGSLFIGGGFFGSLQTRRSTHYALTDRRVLVVLDSFWEKRCYSQAYGQIDQISIEDFPSSGYSDIYFGALPRYVWMGMTPTPRWIWSSWYLPVHMHSLTPHEARRVYQHVETARQAAAQVATAAD